MPGALPLNTPRPFRLSDFCKQKSRHGRSSDDDLLMPGALPLKSGGGYSTRPMVFLDKRHKNEDFSTKTGVFVDKSLPTKGLIAD